MPILRIQIVERDARLSGGLAQSVADSAGVIFQSRPQGTWVIIESIPAEDYAECGGGAVRPVFVEVTLGQWPSQDAMKRQAKELAAAVAHACARPVQNVHILFAPPAKGRIAFGGELN